MARNTKNDIEFVEDVESDVIDDVLEDGTTEDEVKAPKAKKEPKRGDLPEGYVTPVGLAKELTERGLHINREGEAVEVKPQMVYSYIKNAPKDDPFPLETVTDSIGAERNAVVLEAGIAWWERKNERTAARKANAQAKAEAKAKRAEEKAAREAEAEAEADEVEGGEPEADEVE